VGLVVIGMQPPNDQAVYVVGGMTVALLAGWFAVARRTFPGPPHGVRTLAQREALRRAEAAVHEQPHE
jgi:hypothetical protein